MISNRDDEKPSIITVLTFGCGCIVSVVVITGVAWQREKLRQLIQLKDSLGENANDENAPCELVCIIEVSSTANGNETLTTQAINKLAIKLKPVVEPYLFKDVIVNKRERKLKKTDYTTNLQCRSLTALLKVIDLIRGDKLNKILRDKEQKHQKVKTLVDVDSICACVTYYEWEKWRREFKLVHELNKLKGLKKNLGENANDKKAPCELVCVFDASSSADRNEKLVIQVENQTESVCVFGASSTANGNEQQSIQVENQTESDRVSEVLKQEINKLASELESLLRPYLFKDVTVNKRKRDFTTNLQCRSLTALLEVIDLIRGDDWNKCLREKEQKHQTTKIRTQVDAASLRKCVTNYSKVTTKGDNK